MTNQPPQSRSRPHRCRPLLSSFCISQLTFCILQPFAPTSTNAAEPTWTDTRNLGPFICQATFSLEPHQRLLAELPDLQRELTRTLGVPAATKPIYIYIFADADEHKRYLAERFPAVPYRRALFAKVDGQQGVYAYRQAELDIDLRHECTHAMLHSVLTDVPLWLDEGLAEYFEMPPARRAYDHPHLESLRWNMRLGMVRSVEALEQRDELGDMASADYRYSWAWVHFMLHGPEPAHHSLVDYIATLRQSSPPGKLSSRLNTAVPDPSQRLVQHFKQWIH
jgi:hypothetical protein